MSQVRITRWFREKEYTDPPLYKIFFVRLCTLGVKNAFPLPTGSIRTDAYRYLYTMTVKLRPATLLQSCPKRASSIIYIMICIFISCVINFLN